MNFDINISIVSKIGKNEKKTLSGGVTGQSPTRSRCLSVHPSMCNTFVMLLNHIHLLVFKKQPMASCPVLFVKKDISIQTHNDSQLPCIITRYCSKLSIE